MRKRILSLIIIAIIFFSLFSLSSVKAGKSAPADPWGQKEVLNYLFWTADPKLEQDVIKLQKDLGLDDVTIGKLKELGLEERLNIGKLDHGETLESLSVNDFNNKLAAVFANIDSETRNVLGSKYNDFRKWIRNWWNDENEYREKWIAEQMQKQSSILSDYNRGLVFATQYNGYTSSEVALPDKYVKFANLGWWNNIPSAIRPRYSNPPYTVNVYYDVTNKSVLNVTVREVGPWNEDDNYWDSANGSNPRRLFTDLPLGKPEAQAAYQQGYNGGKDQFGRTVSNPAGIDLTPYIASQLGLGYMQNAWVWVNFSNLP